MNDKENFIPITKPWIDEREVEAARRAILSGWVSQGPEVAAFEREFASFVRTKYAIAVSSCTAALHLALLAVGVKPGDEVITVSHSFIATANSIRYCGAVPVFVDIRSDYNMNPMSIEDVITDHTKAILCVHQLGMPCDLKSILEIAHNHNLPVIEDAACAIGSEICWDNTWERIGKPHGDIACFSFHPRKIITTGEGGMITTFNSEWDRKFRMWRQHSMSLSDVVRHSSKDVVFECYTELGYNYRMTDIQAAVGREQLKRLPDIINRRRYLADRYMKLISEVAPWIILPKEHSWARSNWQSFCVQVPNFDQRRVMQGLLTAGVASRRGVMCAHREPAYGDKGEIWSCGKNNKEQSNLLLLKSELLQDSSIILPLYPQMTDEQQDSVVDALCNVYKNLLPKFQ